MLDLWRGFLAPVCQRHSQPPSIQGVRSRANSLYGHERGNRSLRRVRVWATRGSSDVAAILRPDVLLAMAYRVAGATVRFGEQGFHFSKDPRRPLAASSRRKA